MSTGEPSTIGTYELRGVLGRGGSATVYRAYDPALGREIAIKVMAMREHEDAVLRERFRREARAIARLRHPNIVSIYASGEERGVPYLVMELFPAGALSRRLGRPLPVRDAAMLARQIGAALDYAHAQGFVHRDVKPANIFLDGDRAILADFGIVKVIVGEPETRLTEASLSVGTPEYIAPEQALGERIDGRADLYALGIVLYEMLTGAPPYEGNLLDVLNQHIGGTPPEPRRRNPALAPTVSAVLLQALARAPEGRFQSGAALADALDAAIAHSPAPGTARGDDTPDRAARTLLIDVQRERLSGTQSGNALPGFPQTDRPAGGPLDRARPGPTDRTPAIQLPPLPDLTPHPTPATRAERPPATIVDTPLPGGHTAPPTSLTPAPVAGPTMARAAPFVSPPPPPAPASTPWPQATSWPPVAPPPYGVAPLPPTTAGRPGGYGALIGAALAATIIVILAIGGAGLWWLRGQRAISVPTPPPLARQTPTLGAVAGSPTAVVGGTATAVGGPAVASATAADPARAQIEAGDRALAEGRFTEAVASYKEALRVNPNSAVANRQLGLTLWVWNHEPGEIEYLDRATKLAPNDPLAWAYLSYSAVDTHQVERAYAAAQQAVRADQGRAEGYAAVANTYLRYPPDTGDPDAGHRAAKEALDRAKALDPDGVWTLWFESQVLQTLGRYDDGLVPLDRLIAQRPNWPTLYYAKGGIYRALERPDDARAWQERALALDPEYPFALTELGWLAYERGAYDEARGLFERALRMTDDTNDYAHVGYGWTLAAQGDYVNSIARCQRAVQIDGRAPLGYECLGSAYLDGQQRYDDALGNYRKVLELRPQWESGYIGVARVSNAQRNYVGGEAILRQGLDRVKQPRFITYWLGLMLFRQEQYADAQPQFDRAAELVPDNAVIHYQRGLNLERSARFPDARAAYERALALDPVYRDAQDALERLRRHGY